MKPIRIVLSPTRSRPVNIFLGLVVLLVSLLLLLALATYHASDPSLNTASGAAGPHAVENWAGLFGAYLSDLLLQMLGVAAFFLPLWMGGIGWTWMRSRSTGSALLRWSGILFTLAFVPAVFGLMPWHWRWLHMVAVEGVVGRLMAGLLVRYLNIQGAWVVTTVLAAAGIYFAFAISFYALKEGIQDRWLRMAEMHGRWRNWREERAEARAGREAMDEVRERAEAERDLFAAPAPEEEEQRPGFLARLFGRRKARPSGPIDELDEIPAYKRGGFEPDVPAAAPEIPIVPD